jgi:hypothetical protein
MQHDTEGREGFTTLGLNDDAPTGAFEEAAVAEHRRQANSGANWFFLIAAFSVVNSLVVLFNGEWSFIIGLGVTQLIDAVFAGAGEESGGTPTVIALVLDVMVAGFFVVMGLLARRGFAWAFLLGMVMYALDALIFLYVRDWVSIAFHAFALYGIYRGFAAAGKLRRLQPLPQSAA